MDWDWVEVNGQWRKVQLNRLLTAEERRIRSVRTGILDNPNRPPVSTPMQQTPAQNARDRQLNDYLRRKYQGNNVPAFGAGDRLAPRNATPLNLGGNTPTPGNTPPTTGAIVPSVNGSVTPSVNRGSPGAAPTSNLPSTDYLRQSSSTPQATRATPTQAMRGSLGPALASFLLEVPSAIREFQGMGKVWGLINNAYQQNRDLTDAERQQIIDTQAEYYSDPVWTARKTNDAIRNFLIQLVNPNAPTVNTVSPNEITPNGFGTAPVIIGGGLGGGQGSDPSGFPNGGLGGAGTGGGLGGAPGGRDGGGLGGAPGGRGGGGLGGGTLGGGPGARGGGGLGGPLGGPLGGGLGGTPGGRGGPGSGPNGAPTGAPGGPNGSPGGRNGGAPGGVPIGGPSGAPGGGPSGSPGGGPGGRKRVFSHYIITVSWWVRSNGVTQHYNRVYSLEYQIGNIFTVFGEKRAPYIVQGNHGAPNLLYSGQQVDLYYRRPNPNGTYQPLKLANIDSPNWSRRTFNGFNGAEPYITNDSLSGQIRSIQKRYIDGYIEPTGMGPGSLGGSAAPGGAAGGTGGSAGGAPGGSTGGAPGGGSAGGAPGGAAGGTGGSAGGSAGAGGAPGGNAGGSAGAGGAPGGSAGGSPGGAPGGGAAGGAAGGAGGAPGGSAGGAPGGAGAPGGRGGTTPSGQGSGTPGGSGNLGPGNLGFLPPVFRPSPPGSGNRTGNTPGTGGRGGTGSNPNTGGTPSTGGSPSTGGGGSVTNITNISGPQCRYDPSLDNAIMQNTNATNATLEGVNVILGIITNTQLKGIDTKLGPQLPNGGISGKLQSVGRLVAKSWNFLQIDRVLNVLTYITVLHNAYQLSSALTQTLFSAIATSLDAFGIQKVDEDGNEEPYDVGEIVGKWTEGFFKSIFGVETVDGIKSAWKKYSRIYQAATNLLNSIQSMMYDMLDALETLGEYISSIGNSAKKYGVFVESCYNWMSPKFNFAQSRFFRFLQNTQEVVENIEEISSNVVSIQETAAEMQKQKTELDKAVKAAVVEKETTETAEKQSAKSPTIPETDEQKQGD